MAALRDFRDRRGQGVTPNAVETHPKDLNQHPDTESPGCAPGFVYHPGRQVCVPYVMFDLSVWLGSSEAGCPPGWTKARVNLETGQIRAGTDPLEREKETVICIPKVSTNFGQR